MPLSNVKFFHVLSVQIDNKGVLQVLTQHKEHDK